MGDCVPAVPPPSFCDMVTYNVTKDIHTPIPDPHNIKDLDDIAKDIYFTAIEDEYVTGEECLHALKKLLCGSFIPKCNMMNPLRPFVPCESVCHDYAKACGKPRELLCSVFGDPDDPDPQATGKEPFAMCKGTSSFPRFMHREWLSLMPGIDPADKELAMTELAWEIEQDPKGYAADAEASYEKMLDEQGAEAKMTKRGGGGGGRGGKGGKKQRKEEL